MSGERVGAIMEFSKTIYEARKRLGLTQREVADQLRVTESAVSLWESGSKLPSIQTRTRVAEVLDLRTEDIMPELKALDSRTISGNEKLLITVVDCFRRLSPATQQSLTLTMQVLAHARELDGNTSPPRSA